MVESMRPYSRLRSVLTGAPRRYPAVVYSVIAISISWGCWITAFSMLPRTVPGTLLVLAGGFGPLLAALLAVTLRGGSVRHWFRSALGWRRSLRWYGLAIAVPLAVSTVLFAIVVGLGDLIDPGGLADVADPFDLADLHDEATGPPLGLVGVEVAVSTVFAAVLGGGQEEFGWRGFALPHLQARFDALTASVVIGLVWALWHAPLFAFGVYGGNPAVYALTLVAVSVLFTWYYNASRGCLVGAMLFHGAYNASIHVPDELFDVAEVLPVPYAVVQAGVLWAVALALLARYGPATLASCAAVTTGGRSEGDSGSDGHSAAVTATPLD